ncbi:unnamed protein product [Sphenostylis stenocarpa]|uniref:DUF674 domain-containing protein n=1 Tax=Sphenostylis stenocarpa TaxID=92480 RepID=A0AA86VG65_9FABA|nr:unnamed protein product [Sphenostylis stenocarpa]
MASDVEGKIYLKYWVDTKEERVVMAESSGDFINVLFSFLTLPLGTIIRLGNRLDQRVDLGCINHLYESIEKLESDVFWNNICKKMLLSPRNPLEGSCQRLKVKVDDTEPTKYYMCHNCLKKGSNELLLSSFIDVKCKCGTLMRKEIDMVEEAAGDNGVFVKGDAKFLIYDDLTVLRSSPSESIKPPLKFGYTEFKNMKEKYLDRNEILIILKQALTSKSPLTDVLVKMGEPKPQNCFLPDMSSSDSKDFVQIKVIVRKSNNRILFVEADGDFVDFLASILTTPLGSILNLSEDILSLGSIRNLYQSVKNLDSSWFIESSKKSLLNPKVNPHFGCVRNLLNVSQDVVSEYWYGLGVMKDGKGHVLWEKKMISKKQDMLQNPKAIKLLDPRSSDGVRKHEVGFMKRPCLFVMSDDLKVLPMTTTSSIPGPFMKGVPLDDLKEHLVKMRKPQALNLLRASLTSNKDAFTRSLFFLLMKWQFQRFIPFGRCVQ